MRSVRNILWTAFLLALSVPAISDPQYTHWTVSVNPPTARVGEHVQIVLSVNVDEPWHIFSLKVVPNGPIPTTIALLPGRAIAPDGKPVQPTPKVIRDANFENALVEYYERGVAFGVPVKVTGTVGQQTATVKLRYQLCKAGACNRPTEVELPVKFKVEAGKVRTEYLTPITAAPAQPASYQKYTDAAPPDTTPGPAASAQIRPVAPVADQTSQQIAEAKHKGILYFILLSFGAGLAALLTPCVFPMIPITVSFFAKSRDEKGGRPDLRGAFAYSIGIIGTFTGLGLLLTAVFGPAGINRLAQNPWTNVALAILFITLSANLFGAFEIVVPGWLVDKAQSGKGRGGWIGPMAMGFAFTLTTFTCTVAFVGTLLLAAARGDWFYPAIGMLAFSSAFALPFFLLALFPQYLARLPKSGSWMVSVKAFMGFLELAAALKFLSNIDLYLQLGIFTRPVFLAIWAGILVIAGLYLWGWVRLSVDTSKRFGVTRRAIGVASVLAGIWCLAAINGASLGTLEGFLPPSPYPFKNGAFGDAADKWEHDWQQALVKARSEHKPLFINFTGVQCTNCRDMERNVLRRKDVSSELDKFVRVALITDQANESSKRNGQLQDELAHVSTLPYYVIATSDGIPAGAPTGYNKDVPSFLRFLRDGYSDATRTKP